MLQWLGINIDSLLAKVWRMRNDPRSMALSPHGKAGKIVADGLRSSLWRCELGNRDRKEMGRWLDNRAENSRQPFGYLYVLI